MIVIRDQEKILCLLCEEVNNYFLGKCETFRHRDYYILVHINGSTLAWVYFDFNGGRPISKQKALFLLFEEDKREIEHIIDKYQSVESESLTTRFDVLKRDNYCCQICGRSAQDGVKLEVDHKIPKSKGGLYTLSNLWTLCFDCNRGKSDKDLYNGV